LRLDAESGRGHASGGSWYVAFQKSGAAQDEYYVRATRTFLTEGEAKRFAEERLLDGCSVCAGTLNPHFPKRTIGPSEIEHWLQAE